MLLNSARASMLRAASSRTALATARRAARGLCVDARTVTFEPPEDHRSTVVVLHGLGDTALGWVDAAQFWQQTMPHTRFILPTAADRPVTLNFGMESACQTPATQPRAARARVRPHSRAPPTAPRPLPAVPAWYDIRGLGARAEEPCDGIDESRELVESILERERGDRGGAATRLGLVGFSQGGALALYAGLRSSTPLSCVACLSGYLPRPRDVLADLGAEPRGTPPLLMAHGEADEVVKLAWAEEGKRQLLDAGVDLDFVSYPGLTHSASIEELERVRGFMLAHLEAEV